MSTATVKKVRKPKAKPEVIDPDSVHAYILNTSDNGVVISDMNLAWGKFGATYEDFVRPLTREKVDASIGIQRMLSDDDENPTFKEITKEEMVAIFRERDMKRKAAQAEAIGTDGNMEDEMVELPTPQDVLDQMSPKGGIDHSQRVEDLVGA